MAAPATPPDPHKRPAPPRPAAPPVGLVVARWTYLDDARTHEIHAGLRPGAMPTFVVQESVYQNEHAEEIIEQELPIEAPWEAQLYHSQLECRLATLGKHWRHDANDPS